MKRSYALFFAGVLFYGSFSYAGRPLTDLDMRYVLKTVTESNMVEHLKSFLRHPKDVSALFPCSSYAAAALCERYLLATQVTDESLKLLEIGAGIGAITDYLAMHLRDQDTLHVVECDEDAVKVLRRKYHDRENIVIHCTRVERWKPTESVDFIICTLPFNSFSQSAIDRILSKCKNWIRDGGGFSYVEYWGFGWLKQHLVKLIGVQEGYSRAQAYLARFREQCVFQSVLVKRNIPPILIHHANLADHNPYTEKNKLA